MRPHQQIAAQLCIRYAHRVLHTRHDVLHGDADTGLPLRGAHKRHSRRIPDGADSRPLGIRRDRLLDNIRGGPAACAVVCGVRAVDTANRGQPHISQGGWKRSGHIRIVGDDSGAVRRPSLRTNGRHTLRAHNGGVVYPYWGMGE